MTTRVQVEIVAITAKVSPFGEGDLEIYGHLGTWKVGRDFGGNPIDRGHFLGFNQQNDGGAVSIAINDSFNINSISPAFTIENDEELWVGGHLKEDDRPPDDNDSLGDHHKMIKHDDIRDTTHVVSFFEGIQIADASFRVHVLGVS